MSQVESLDRLLYNCTSGIDQVVSVESISKFCDAVNKEVDGPATAARLLGHKIQSPQEQESLNALCVADECVKKCGRKFQDELGKFRFLNEIIKMISPKYFGDRTSKKVKDKCIELLYRWSVELRHEPKILEAYEMLKKQGIIDDDPILPAVNGELAAASTQASNQPGASHDKSVDAAAQPAKEQQHSIFEDDEKSKLLARLLRSKHPDDLQAANRLIKNMVKQDEEKQEKISQRYHLLETVRNNIKLLNEMIDCYQMSGGSSSSDRDIIKELYQNLEKERPKIFKFASETEDKDSDGISQILQVNDDVVQVCDRYKQVIIHSEAKASTQSSSQSNAGSSLLAADLAGLDLNTAPTSAGPFSSFLLPSNTQKQSAVNGNTAPSSSLFDLMSTPSIFSNLPSQPAVTPVKPVSMATSNLPYSDLDTIFSATPSSSNLHTAQSAKPTTSSVEDIGLLSLDSLPPTAGLAAPLVPSGDSSLFGSSADSSDIVFDNKKSALEDLDFLGQDLLQKSKPLQQPLPPVVPSGPQVRPTLNQLKSTNIEKNLSQPVPPAVSATQPVPADVQPLTNVYVPLETVKPGDLPSITVFDQDSIKIILHFAQNKPREDVAVMVLSMMSTKTSPVKALVFQAAVPKSMKVKLQPPSGTELPAFNPILPPSAITQVMVLANPTKEKVKLKYKLSYTVNGASFSHTGDVVDFPL